MNQFVITRFICIKLHFYQGTIVCILTIPVIASDTRTTASERERERDIYKFTCCSGKCEIQERTMETSVNLIQAHLNLVLSSYICMLVHFFFSSPLRSLPQ